MNIKTLLISLIALYLPLHGALDNHTYDARVDWRKAAQLQCNFLKSIKEIPLSTDNKLKIFQGCVPYMNVFGAEYVLEILIDYAAINTTQDMGRRSADIISDEQWVTYSKHLMQLQKLEVQMIDAARLGNATLMIDFLKQGCRINAQDGQGYTPLMAAAVNGHTECIRILLQQPNIAVNAINNHNNTALMIAKHFDHTECVQLLENHPGIKQSYCTLQ